MKISKQIELDYGHTLPNHYSFCNQIHGHRARVIATVEGEVSQEKGSSEQGMVMDFSFLKKALMDGVHAKLDHGFAVWKDDKEDLEFIVRRNKKVLITEEPPTAEYLAKWAYNEVGILLPKKVNLEVLTWYETPNSWAEYRG